MDPRFLCLSRFCKSKAFFDLVRSYFAFEIPPELKISFNSTSFFHGQMAVVAQSSCTFYLLTVYFNLISGVSRASTFLFNVFTFYLLHIPNPFLSLKFVLAPPHSGLCTYNYHPGMLCCIRAALSAVVFMRRLAVSLLSGLVGMRISVPCWSPIHLQRIQSG